MRTRHLMVVKRNMKCFFNMQVLFSKGTPYLAYVVTTSRQALAVVQHIKPRLFLLDYRVYSINGLALYDQLHAITGLESVPAIITTTDFERRHQEIEQRHLLCLSKPFDLDVLLSSIEYLLS